jgi:hypothetical protein
MTINFIRVIQLILEMKTPNFTGNRPELRRPRTQHHLQQTSHQLFLLSSNYNKREYTLVGT